MSEPMTRTWSDEERSRRLAMVDGVTGEVEWEGPLVMYIEDNEHLSCGEDEAELSALLALPVGAELPVGGGAQPFYLLRRTT